MGTKERKEQEKKLRRNMIINAAENVFFLHGIDKSTMNQVAKECELSKGTLYLYFKSKDELYRAILLRGYSILKRELDKALSEDKNGFENLIGCVKTYMEFSSRHPGYFNALLHYESDTFDLNNLDHEAEECLKSGKELIFLVVEILESGHQDGSIRKNLSPLEEALSLWAQLTGLLHMIKKRQDIIRHLYQVEKDALCRHFLQMLTDNMKNKAAFNKNLTKS